MPPPPHTHPVSASAHHSPLAKLSGQEEIIRMGETGNGCLYVITRGKVVVTGQGKDGEKYQLCEQVPGDYFGEVSLVKPGA